jgi:hypothetical protein
MCVDDVCSVIYQWMGVVPSLHSKGPPEEAKQEV